MEPRIELYRSTSPLFPGGGELIKYPIIAEGTGWDSTSLDTPYILTDDIYRNTFPNNQLWVYYSGNPGVGGIGTSTGLTIDTDIEAALAPVGGVSDPTIFDSTSYHNDGGSIGSPLSITGKIDGAADFVASGQEAFNAGQDGSLDLSAFTLEAWAKLPDAQSGGPAGNGWENDPRERQHGRHTLWLVDTLWSSSGDHQWELLRCECLTYLDR